MTSSVSLEDKQQRSTVNYSSVWFGCDYSNITPAGGKKTPRSVLRGKHPLGLKKKKWLNVTSVCLKCRIWGKRLIFFYPLQSSLIYSDIVDAPPTPHANNKPLVVVSLLVIFSSVSTQDNMLTQKWRHLKKNMTCLHNSTLFFLQFKNLFQIINSLQ